MTMHLSPQGAAFIGSHEGRILKWYRDPVGIGTIGAGFTWASAAFREWWAANKPGVKFGPGATMTEAEIDTVLALLVDRQYGAAVSRLLGRDVPQHVYDGMSSAVFNLGEGSLDWRWAQAAKRGEYAEAAELLRSTGTTAKGKRLPGLVRRRFEEARLIEAGDYGDAAVSTLLDTSAGAMDDGVLVRGEQGRDVENLQADLAKAGFDTGKLDGKFGPGTEAAVMAFQRSVALADDGMAGPQTLAALRTALAPMAAPVTTPIIEPAASIIPPVASPRPDLIGRPSAVVERILRDEGSRQIAKANAVIKKAVVNRIATAGPAGFIVSILAGLGNVPTWVWIAGGLALLATLVILFLSWRQADEAKAIKVARVDDAVTGASAYGGPARAAGAPS